MKKLIKTIMVAGLTLLLAQTSYIFAQKLPKNIRMVIGSKSTGGDTYQNASILAEALSDHLGVNIKVDPVGASQAFKVLSRDRRGTTIMVFHDQSYLSQLYEVEGSVDIFKEFVVGPTIAINPGNAYLVPKNSSYQTMEDIFKAAAGGKKIRVAIQPGGVSEIGFTAIRNAAKLRSPGSEKNIVAVNTGSQSSKNQAMWDNLADVINGSIQANEQFTQLPKDDLKAMRFVWVTAAPNVISQAPAEGMGNTDRNMLLTYTSPQTSVTFDGKVDFTFDKEFFVIYNSKMASGLMNAIDKAMAELYAKGEIQKRQLKSFFIPNFRPRAEAQAHLKKKRNDYARIIKQLKN